MSGYPREAALSSSAAFLLGIGLHFSHDIAAMCLHRDLADAQLAADLFIQHAGDYQCHYFSLSRGKQRITSAELPDLGFLPKDASAVLKGAANGAQEDLVTKWLRQEFDCSRLHSLDRHRNITSTCDENDRHVTPIDSHALLKIETIEVGKANVQYETTWNKNSRTGEELLCRGECPGLLNRPGFTGGSKT
jgi:hypothetical protein